MLHTRIPVTKDTVRHTHTDIIQLCFVLILFFSSSSFFLSLTWSSQLCIHGLKGIMLHPVFSPFLLVVSPPPYYQLVTLNISPSLSFPLRFLSFIHSLCSFLLHSSFALSQIEAMYVTKITIELTCCSALSFDTRPSCCSDRKLNFVVNPPGLVGAYICAASNDYKDQCCRGISMALQPFVGGSARRKAATCTQDSTNTEETYTDILASGGIRTHYPSV
jgi:hypothetical protein